MPIARGSRFGPYEVRSLIGSGGMGEIYRARDARLDRDVAVKIISPRLAHDPTLAVLVDGANRRRDPADAARPRTGPGSTLFLGQLGELYGLTGQQEKARQVLGQLSAASAERYVPPYHFAYVHAGLADLDAAMDCLEQAYDERAGAIYGVKGSFLFRNLHTHPRFKALLAKMNLGS